jgi:hypothetical protein
VVPPTTNDLINNHPVVGMTNAPVSTNGVDTNLPASTNQ